MQPSSQIMETTSVATTTGVSASNSTAESGVSINTSSVTA
jgi:hypothetical protein